MVFEEFKRLMAFETKGKFCIEILFEVQDSAQYNWCWMGKLPDKETKNDVFWYGLTDDGKNAYDYSTFEEFTSAKVFDGKSLLDIWDNVTIKSVNGCDPHIYLDR